LVSPTGYVLLDQAWFGLFRDADLPPRRMTAGQTSPPFLGHDSVEKLPVSA
jgi:hypothetical protein